MHIAWTRAEIKTKAKQVLKHTYWVAFIVSLILMISGAQGHEGVNRSGSSSRTTQQSSVVMQEGEEINFSIGMFKAIGVSERTFHFLGDFLGGIIYAVIKFIAIVMTAGVAVFLLLFRIIFGYHLEIGGRRYFLDTAMGGPNTISTMFGYFKGNIYSNIISVMFRRSLFTFLWSLLFVFPGIVKSYEYSMIPYIMAENPNISHADAFELSKRMTYGHKMDMFILDLSFIGWYLLGWLLLFVGTALVWPYENATKAQLYLRLNGSFAGNTVN